MIQRLKKLLAHPAAHLVAAMALLVVHTLYFYGWSLDDFYVSYRYARNLAEGHGLGYNPGERVEGYSDFTYVLVLACAAAARVDLPTFARVFGFVCSLATFLVFWIGLKTARGDEENEKGRPGGVIASAVSHFALYLLALSGPFALWSIGGSETPLYALFGTAALLLCAREMEGGGRNEARGAGAAIGGLPWSALLCALAAMTRPEGVIWFAVCLIARILWVIQGRGRDTWARLAVWVGCFALMYGAYNAWRVWYFGEWLPNTFYAKATSSLAQRLPKGWLYIGGGLLLSGGPLALFALAYAAVTVWREPAEPLNGGARRSPGGASPFDGRAIKLLAFGLCAAQMLFILWTGGDWMPLGRFMAPAAPALAWLAHDAVVWLWGMAGARQRFFRRGAAAFGIAVCVALMLWIERRRSLQVADAPRAGALQRQIIEVGKWLHGYAKPGDGLATIEAGIVPYYSGLPTIDLRGFLDKHLARQRGAPNYKVDTRYVLSRKPRFVFMVCKSGEPFEALYPKGPDDALLRAPEFLRNYEVRKTWQRGPRRYGTAVMVVFERKKG